MTSAIFQNQIHLLAVAAIVKDTWPALRPLGMADNLHGDEVLQGLAGDLLIGEQPLFIGTDEMQVQAAVDDVDLGLLALTLADAWTPCGQGLHQEDGFEQVEVAASSLVIEA